MKGIVLLLSLLLIPMLTFAQSIEVKYQVFSKKRAETIKKMKEAKGNQQYQGMVTGLSAEKKDSFRLVINGRQSSFERIEPEEELSDDHGPKIVIVSPSYSDEGVSVYKNLTDMEVIEIKSLFGRNYSITQSLPHYQWKVSSETKKIMGLDTYKATIGDSITAWFCPTIPVQDGPGLYCGLPGLILDLEDNRTIYSCTELNTNSTSDVGKPKKGKEVTEEEFEKLQHRALK